MLFSRTSFPGVVSVLLFFCYRLRVCVCGGEMSHGDLGNLTDDNRESIGPKCQKKI